MRNVVFAALFALALGSQAFGSDDLMLRPLMDQRYKTFIPAAPTPMFAPTVSTTPTFTTPVVTSPPVVQAPPVVSVPTVPAPPPYTVPQPTYVLPAPAAPQPMYVPAPQVVNPPCANCTGMQGDPNSPSSLYAAPSNFAYPPSAYAVPQTYPQPGIAYSPIVVTPSRRGSRFPYPYRVNYTPGPPYAGSPTSALMVNGPAPASAFYAPMTTTVPTTYSPATSLYSPGPLTYSP